jgi:putative tricarboxylic transport membrane protein
MPGSMEPKQEGEAADRSPRSYRDIWAVAAILAFCAVVYAVTLTFDTVPDAIAQGMQPAGFPQLVIGTMAVLALFVAWNARAGSTEKTVPPDRLVYWTSLLMILTLPVLIWVDFFVGLTIATFAIGYLWGERRLRALAIYSVLQSIVLFIVFAMILRVRFPHGIVVDLFT